MKLNELVNTYGDYELKDGFMDFLEAPKPKSVWNLEYGDDYYYLGDDGVLYNSSWLNDRVDTARRSVGNCFLSVEECEFASQQKKIIAELKRLGSTEDMMSLGGENKLKYCIRYLHNEKRLDVFGLYCTHYSPSIFFKSKKDALKAIKEIGEDHIKKYLFYVKED